jgi:ATPase components of ABC transporters with duplicated ATPase domains
MVGVSKFYDKKPVLKDIYLSYFYGAKIGVLGLNGSGKSSLLRILAGVDKDFNGETVISPGFTSAISNRNLCSMTSGRSAKSWKRPSKKLSICSRSSKRSTRSSAKRCRTMR